MTGASRFEGSLQTDHVTHPSAGRSTCRCCQVQLRCAAGRAGGSCSPCGAACIRLAGASTPSLFFVLLGLPGPPPTNPTGVCADVSPGWGRGWWRWRRSPAQGCSERYQGRQGEQTPPRVCRMTPACILECAFCRVQDTQWPISHVPDMERGDRAQKKK